MTKQALSAVTLEKKRNKIDLEKNIVPALINERRISGFGFSDYLRDLGTPKRIQRFEEDLASGLVASFANPIEDIVDITCSDYFSLTGNSRTLKVLRQKRFSLTCCGYCNKSDLRL